MTENQYLARALALECFRSADGSQPIEFHTAKTCHYEAIYEALAMLLLATWFGPLWRFNLAHPLGR